MRKKILIAVDQSIHAKQAMKYAAKIGGVIDGMDFVLFHVQPMISQYLIEESLTKPKTRAQLEKINNKNREAADALLENCKMQLTQMGIDAASIELKTAPRDSGVADDILNMVETGAYDAVLIGRRGLSSLQELFIGSVTTNLISHSRQIPVWVVDGEVDSDNLLIAVDGSVNSLRAVDHAAFILSTCPRIKLALLHVPPRLGDFCEIDIGDIDADGLKQSIKSANRRCITDFQAQAFNMLKEAGISESQINFRQIERRMFPAKAIVEEIQTKDYGTLVIGRQGMSASKFMGRVAGAVVQKINNRAVWIVP